MHELKQRAIFFALAIVLIALGDTYGQKPTQPVSVTVVNTSTEPIPVRGIVSVGTLPPVSISRAATALIFQARDISFASLNTVGAIDVSSYGQIRVVVQNSDFPVNLVVSLVEDGNAIGILDVVEVPGCPDGGCVGTRSITRVYDTPGRAIRFSTNAEPGARGDVHIFGR
jgi:hypothetical protein